MRSVATVDYVMDDRSNAAKKLIGIKYKFQYEKRMVEKVHSPVNRIKFIMHDVNCAQRLYISIILFFIFFFYHFSS